MPYPIGEAYQIGQTFCDASGSHRSSFAYDINMPQRARHGVCQQSRNSLFQLNEWFCSEERLARFAAGLAVVSGSG